MEELSALEKKLLIALRGTEGGPGIEVETLVDGKTFSSIQEVMNAASWLKTRDLVEISEKAVRFVGLGAEGKRYLEEGLPERQLFEVCKREGKIGMAEAKELLGESFGIALMHLKNAGAVVDGGTIKLPAGEVGEIEAKIREREEFLKVLAEMKEETILDRNLLNYLLKRKNVLAVKEKVVRKLALTENGAAVAAGISAIEEEVSQLTPELIQTGKWRDTKLRKYDVTRYAPRVYGGREHPLNQIASQVRKIFLSMGFTEIDYGIVQNAFWNMDALFVPQDHPARDMQDTFYLAFPEKMAVENEEWVEAVKQMHENGGDTGSEGWGYRWSRDEAEKTLLRTHTTVNTIRFLAEHPDEDAKVFSIARVFRNENVDATHLPEFMQIEGIVVEEGASLAMLIGVLREFYKRIGFPNVRFHPSYFPFTEPSLEVYTVLDGKTLELGGAGIFRPEVTAPFGVKKRVLAWGLGLERLAMLKYGFESLPEIYSNRLEVLRRPYAAKFWR
ncbi:MAG: phenylalanine--tRNA ligase subunit alpha [Thermoplasmata archaeon]|nr:phenylalanine--tRNA ligase subunit alpha [Thermoplasmata archaeon]